MLKLVNIIKKKMEQYGLIDVLTLIKKRLLMQYIQNKYYQLME